MPTNPYAPPFIPAADLPVATPGDTDTVVGVDEASGNARRFPKSSFGDMSMRPDLASTASGKGSELVGFKQSGAGAVGQDVQAKIRLTEIHVKDFGAIGSGTETTALQNAINAAIASGVRRIRLADNTAYVTASLSNFGSVDFIGNGSRITHTSATNVYKVTDVQQVGSFSLPSIFSWFTDGVGLNADLTGYSYFDIDSKKPAVTKRYYVRNSGGSDANDGLTFATGLATISAALAKTDVDEVVLQPGDFYADAGAWGTLAMTRHVGITVLGGKRARIFGCKSGYTWVADATYTNTYTITESSVIGSSAVWDEAYTDSNGDFLGYAKAASASACNTTPGSYYYDSGASKVYVRCIDGRAPTGNDLKVLRTSYTCRITGAFSLWTENIEFLGLHDVCAESSVAGTRPVWYGKNCHFKYVGSNQTPGSGGFRTRGGDSYMVNCLAARNFYDGFNYHAYSTGINVGVSFEQGCTGRHNGLVNGAGNNQGSTNHDGVKTLRINGVYHNNDGQNIADTGASYSFNVGCDCYDSRKLTTPRNYEAADGTVMYLVACKTSGKKQWDVALTGTPPNNGKLFYYLSAMATYSGNTNDAKQFNPFVNPNPV